MTLQLWGVSDGEETKDFRGTRSNLNTVSIQGEQVEVVEDDRVEEIVLLIQFFHVQVAVSS